ncbi:RNA recognition motif domain-containing protein [Ditylenchus destructor]|uniref:Splicing factor 3B subunit 4 n=1 Tax=Ditylenchus destructor TaxID=166010 RepID=A0AAD4RD12_9BILA|nr:RNA recognition motif domain-containing protein [Ditylenchus destructor]
MASGPVLERNQDATIYVGGLDEKVSESILWELFVQSGPVVSVNMPKDRITGSHQGFGFVEFMGEEDADYAIKIMNMIKLFGKPIKVNKASANEKNMDVGANLFVGNLDPEVDEKLLFDTFSAFGVILQVPKIMRDTDTGNSKGFAFINFASFEASDMALEAMNGQYLCNRPITCSYAFKKDTKGERHGTAAERLLAAQNPLFPSDRPHQIFSDIPGLRPMPIPPPVPPQMMGVMPPHGGMMPPPAPPPPPSIMPLSTPPPPSAIAPPPSGVPPPPPPPKK